VLYMISKRIADVGLDDLEALLGNVREGKTIEYKRELPAHSDAEKVKLLKAVSSFANTSGGDLIIGLAADGDLASSITGLPLVESDSYRLRVEQVLASGLEPRLPKYEVHSVQIDQDRYALIIRATRSWLAPHRVTINGKFYGRTSAGSYELDVGELRSAFVQSATLAERIRQFRTDRIAKIAAGVTAFRLLPGGTYVLHVVPFSAFESTAVVPIGDVSQQPHLFPPIARDSPPHWQINFDGFVTASNADGPSKPQRSYVQVFRSGAIEALNSSLTLGESNNIPLPTVLAATIKYAAKYAHSLQSIGIEPPYAVLASMVDVQGKKLLHGFPDTFAGTEGLIIDQNQLHFGEAIFETVPKTQEEAARLLRSTLDHMANTAGLGASPCFDRNDKYVFRI
jgi:hypothetical protein